MVLSTIRFQIQAIKRNLITFLFLLSTALFVLYIGYRHNTLKQAIAYLLVMAVSAFFIDFFAVAYPAKNDFEVRRPKRETVYFLLCFFLGMVFFYLRFSGAVDWQHLSGFIKLAVMPLVLFVFPVGLAIIMLSIKYKPADLGLRLQGFIVTIPIILISVITNRIISPQSLTLDKVIAESGGVLGALYSGFILAGLSEEFFRVVGQTRIGALLKNKGLGWFITTIIWAFMHAPKWYSEDHNITEVIFGSIRIIPIGLMWGYMTHRTKSFLPSVMVHGTNVWGLQNF